MPPAAAATARIWRRCSSTRWPGSSPVAVPFQGDGQAVPQVLGNHVPYMFLGIPPAASAILGGQLRGLAVTSKMRSPILPDVPTIQESGVPSYEMVNWWGFFAPAGMSPKMVADFNKALGEIIQPSRHARETADSSATS